MAANKVRQAAVIPFLGAVVVWGSLVFGSPVAHAEQVDEDQALTSLKNNRCTKCHTLNKRKKGPSYQEVARKYAGKADAEATLYRHLTGNPVVKLEDGDEEHSAPNITDRKELDNLIRFILRGKFD